MSTEVSQVKPIELEGELSVIVSNSRVELTKAQSHAFAFSDNMQQVQELSKALTLMDKNNPSAIDVKTANLNRKALVKNRTAAEVIKDERKSDLLVESKLIDNLFGVVKNTSLLTESEYSAIEKFAENKEKERKEKLHAERLAKCISYFDATIFYPLGEMSDEAFENLLNGQKLAYEAKIEADAKAERERLEAIRIEEKRKQDEVLEKERAEREKAEAELRAKAESEKQQKAANEKAKFEAEQAEKAKLKAPDKEKLKGLAVVFGAIQMPDLKTKEAENILENIKILQGKLVNYITEQSEKL